MQNTTNVLDALGGFCSNEDGTYELLTHRPVEYSYGYQVSFVRPEADKLSREEWDTLARYCCNYLGSEVYIGVYGGDAEVSTENNKKSSCNGTIGKRVKAVRYGFLSQKI